MMSKLLDPTGIITGGVFLVARMLAETPAFQRRVGAADWFGALAHVKRWRHSDDPRVIEASRPFAVIWPEEVSLTRFAGGSRDAHQRAGVLALVLSDVDRRTRESGEDSGDEFAGWVDQVINELAAKGDVNDRPSLRLITLGGLPSKPGWTIAHSSQWAGSTTGNGWWDAFFRIEYR